MLSIRLSRFGKKKYPVYRVIVMDKTKDPYGKYLENLGTYNPHSKEIILKKERIQYWISKGAQPTATVNNILVDQEVIKSDKVRASKSKPGKKKKAILKAKEVADEAQKKAEATAIKEDVEIKSDVEVKEDKKEEVVAEPVAEEVKAE